MSGTHKCPRYTIRWSPPQWERIADAYGRWWSGELDRPLIHLALRHKGADAPPPPGPMHARTSLYPLEVPAREIVLAWEYALSRNEYRGDGFPSIWPDFGPGVLAAFLGCLLRPDPLGRTTWFEPPELQSIERLDLTYDSGNIWLQRVKAICREAIERWQGLVQVGMTDLGGTLDVLASFRPGEHLLLDLVDSPADVQRHADRIHELWFQCFEEINATLQPTNPSYTAWTPIFSSEPYYMLQCDFCYMISPQMFDEFVKPELTAACNRIPNAFYHLDGPGQLPHLDSLLDIESLKGVQWIPGAGQPDVLEWIDVFRRIRAAGKLIHLLQSSAGHRTLDIVSELLGDARGIFFQVGAPVAREDDLMRWLESWGAA